MSKKIEKTIIKIIKENLNTKKNITLNSGPYSVDNWDSLKHIQILTILSKKFKVKITDQDYELLFDINSIVNFFKINEKK